jgi:hypothetical protein
MLSKGDQAGCCYLAPPPVRLAGEVGLELYHFGGALGFLGGQVPAYCQDLHKGPNSWIFWAMSKERFQERSL